MPRIARIVAVGLPHHLTQRGNYKQDVFLDDRDRKKYLTWVNEYSDRYKLNIIAYCLMTNHVHFIGIPEREDSLARTFQTAHMRYTQYFNRRIESRGHLWQGRFYSCVLDEKHFIAATRYIERNPVRAKLVKIPWEWKWSSAKYHVGRSSNSLLKMGNIFELFDMPPDEWGKYICNLDDREFMKKIKKYTLTGRPFGEITFIKALERKFERRLKALPRGRPKKKIK